jgi:threonine dehydratase
MTVDTDAVCAAIKDVFVDTAASSSQPVRWLPLLRSSNIAKQKTRPRANRGDFARRQHELCICALWVAERAEVGEEREALFAVTTPPRSAAAFGVFGALIEVARRPRSVTEFNYRISDNV